MKIALRSGNGFYVCAESGGGRELVCNRTSRGEWETFGIHHLTGPSSDLKEGEEIVWVSRDGSAVVGGTKVATSEIVAAPGSVWIVHRPSSTTIALRNKRTGICLRAEGNGGTNDHMTCTNPDSKNIGPFETFTLEVVESNPS